MLDSVFSAAGEWNKVLYHSLNSLHAVFFCIRSQFSCFLSHNRRFLLHKPHWFIKISQHPLTANAHTHKKLFYSSNFSSSRTCLLLFFLSLRLRQIMCSILRSSISEQEPNKATLKIEFRLSSSQLSIYVPVKPTIIGA